ncbi:MAG: DUF1858 domain-containing protein [Anaerovoracaceae bacterium]|jgi:hybrid cluster-associated redox disulfide protein
MLVHESMMVDEVLELDPEITEILLSHGLNCESCPGASMETLKEAAEGHNIDLSQLLFDLNNFLRNKE